MSPGKTGLESVFPNEDELTLWACGNEFFCLTVLLPCATEYEVRTFLETLYLLMLL